MNELEKARKTINSCDEQMAKLFEKRMDAVQIVAAYKKERGLPIEDLKREEEQVAKNSVLVSNEDYRSYYIRFLLNNIEVSKKYQHQLLEGMTVAYSGVPGAFAQLAVKKIFPDGKSCAYPNFKSAYNAVVSGEVDCAVLPIENSNNGDVGQVMDLSFEGSLFVNGVYDIEVSQHLLALKGTTIDEIDTVISHSQALGQCEAYIEKHGFKTQEAENTAIAAKQVSVNGKHNIAAIGSEEAAKEYGLKILEARINESSDNTTKFVVFSRTATPSKNGNFILLFTAKNEVGSLGKAISVIGENGFNMRSLKSRPTKDLVWSYYFFVEAEGDLSSEQGKKMLEELKKCCNFVKVLGCYENEIKL